MAAASLTADHDLEYRVQRFLEAQSYPALQRLKAQVIEGVVRLSGRVSSYYELQLAISCVRRVAEVRNLDVRVDVSR